MKLTKQQRETLRMKFAGCCAYCGHSLGKVWHADHFKPVLRDAIWESGAGFKFTGGLLKPERDTLDNLMPACPPCNIDKHSMSLEGWRQKLQRATEVLAKSNPTYRHAVRFGLVNETAARVVFYFEKVQVVATVAA